MPKTGQTKKKVSPVKASVEVFPFSTKEKKALQVILDTPHWGRRKLKDEFIAEYNRIPKEVDVYIAANGKRKKNGIITDNSGSISEPERKIVSLGKGGEPSNKRSSEPSQLRIPVKRMTFEKGILTIDFEQ